MASGKWLVKALRGLIRDPHGLFLAALLSSCHAGRIGRVEQPAFLTTRRSKHAIRPPGLRCACLPCSTYCPSTPARDKQLAPRPDGPLTHFASPRGEKCRLMARAPLPVLHGVSRRTVKLLLSCAFTDLSTCPQRLSVPGARRHMRGNPTSIAILSPRTRRANPQHPLPA